MYCRRRLQLWRIDSDLKNAYMDTDYLQITKNIYQQAANEPQAGLCCRTTPVWRLPGLSIPGRMLEMNYDERLRALCLKGALPLSAYVKMITDTGFGTVEIRAKRPYGVDDGHGHVLLPNHPLAICDKTAGALGALQQDDIFISASTWFYDGGGCC